MTTERHIDRARGACIRRLRKASLPQIGSSFSRYATETSRWTTCASGWSEVELLRPGDLMGSRHCANDGMNPPSSRERVRLSLRPVRVPPSHGGLRAAALRSVRVPFSEENGTSRSIVAEVGRTS